MTSSSGARALVAALEAPSDNRIDLMRRLRREARARDLVGALELEPSALTRQLLCDLIGFKAAASGIPILVRHLSDRAPKVRAAAADALGKVYMRRERSRPDREGAGEAVHSRLLVEKDPGVKSALVAAIGATYHRHALGLVKSAAADARLAIAAAWTLERLSGDA